VKFRQVKEDETGFQIAPLIDMVFLLLVFFVVTSAYQAMEKEQEIALPGATTSKPKADRPQTVVINVTEDGRIIVNRAEWDLSKLRRRLKLLAQTIGEVPPTVIIRADRGTRFENVTDVLDTCTAVNLRNVAFVTVEKK